MNQKIDVEKVVDWLNRKWKGAKICPICKNNNWSISERPVELRQFHGGIQPTRGPVYPLIPITCEICGYTFLFNAIVAELVESKQIESTPLPKTNTQPKPQRKTGVKQ